MHDDVGLIYESFARQINQAYFPSVCSSLSLVHSPLLALIYKIVRVYI
jgi:hypothetical protein